jgi:hypothetical protein
MSAEKKTDQPKERSEPSGPGVSKKKDEVSQQDLDRVTGGHPFPLNPQPLPP